MWETTRAVIDPLQLRHIFRGISIYYPEAAILVYRNTLAIKTCPASLVSVYIALTTYVAITFCPIQHILEALLVHDCVYRDRHRSCYLQKREFSHHILELMTSAAMGLFGNQIHADHNVVFASPAM